jgi:hypothetical protein
MTESIVSMATPSGQALVDPPGTRFCPWSAQAAYIMGSVETGRSNLGRRGRSLFFERHHDAKRSDLIFVPAKGPPLA